MGFPSACQIPRGNASGRSLGRTKPKQHGIIVRTAAEGITAEEIERDVRRLVQQWEEIEALSGRSQSPSLLYREPEMAFRFIREEFNKDFRGVVIDDPEMFERVRTYVERSTPPFGRPDHLPRPGDRVPRPCSNATTCTSSFVRLWIARCGCHRADR
ncbi:MAG: hypothetical protein Ct9H300mP31_16810 [Acidimicrobiaceae bacterium]|nr:MAG: hypothetical protein Ct9H300mP31_16810 [Acidimicrobiaceae bacterium]